MGVRVLVIGLKSPNFEAKSGAFQNETASSNIKEVAPPSINEASGDGSGGQ